VEEETLSSFHRLQSICISPATTLQQVLHRRLLTPVALQPLPDHQPNYYPGVIDALSQAISVLAAQVAQKPRRARLSETDAKHPAIRALGSCIKHKSILLSRATHRTAALH
jgi:hypothetical protein